MSQEYDRDKIFIVKVGGREYAGLITGNLGPWLE